MVGFQSRRASLQSHIKTRGAADQRALIERDHSMRIHLTLAFIQIVVFCTLTTGQVRK